MKNEILKVARDLETGTIDEKKAKDLLLGLFGVTYNPLTIERVANMLDLASSEAWKAAGGDPMQWKIWWKNRNYVSNN